MECKQEPIRLLLLALNNSRTEYGTKPHCKICMAVGQFGGTYNNNIAADLVPSQP